MNNSLHSSNFHSSLFECTLHMIKNKIAHYMNYERGLAHAQQRFDAVEPLRTRVYTSILHSSFPLRISSSSGSLARKVSFSCRCWSGTLRFPEYVFRSQKS